MAGRLPLAAVAVAAAVLLAAAPAAAQEGCEDVFSVTSGPGQLALRHDGAEYNCCAGGFGYAIEQTAGEILIVEREVPGAPCDCYCCYDLRATFENLAPGTYELVVSYEQFGGGGRPGEWRQQVEIPGAAAGPPVLVGVEPAECRPSATEPRTWSGLKGIYR